MGQVRDNKYLQYGVNLHNIKHGMKREGDNDLDSVNKPGITNIMKNENERLIKSLEERRLKKICEFEMNLIQY